MEGKTPRSDALNRDSSRDLEPIVYPCRKSWVNGRNKALILRERLERANHPLSARRLESSSRNPVKRFLLRCWASLRSARSWSRFCFARLRRNSGSPKTANTAGTENRRRYIIASTSSIFMPALTPRKSVLSFGAFGSKNTGTSEPTSKRGPPKLILPESENSIRFEK